MLVHAIDPAVHVDAELLVEHAHGNLLDLLDRVVEVLALAGQLSHLRQRRHRRGLNSGRLDHVAADLVEQVAPALNSHAQRIANLPAVLQYYAKFDAQ